MKKYITLFLVFILTGCTVNYSLNIDNDTMLEKVSITLPDSEIDNYDRYENQVNAFRPVYFGIHGDYNVSEREDEYNHYVDLSYNHDIQNYTNSVFINKCYQNNFIKNTDDYISIDTSDLFECIKMEDGYYANNVKIKIVTDLKSISNNADVVKKNTYIWNIDESNYQNKPIHIKLKKYKSGQEKLKSSVGNVVSAFDDSPSKYLFPFCVVLLIVGLIIGFVVKTQNRRNNKF